MSLRYQQFQFLFLGCLLEEGMTRGLHQPLESQGLAARLPEGGKKGAPFAHAKTKVLCLVRELWEMPGLVEGMVGGASEPRDGLCALSWSPPIRLVWAQK